MRLSSDINSIPLDYQFFELQEAFYDPKTTPRSRIFNWYIIPELFQNVDANFLLEPITEETPHRKQQLINIGLGQCWKFDNPGYAALFKQKLVTHKIKGVSHRKRVHNWLRYLAFDNPIPKLKGRRNQLTPICNDPLCFNPLHQRQHKTEWIINFLTEHVEEGLLNTPCYFNNPPYEIPDTYAKSNTWLYMFTTPKVDASKNIHLSPISPRSVSKICMRIWYDPEMFFRRLNHYTTTFHGNALSYGLKNPYGDYMEFNEFWERTVLPIISTAFVNRVKEYGQYNQNF